MIIMVKSDSKRGIDYEKSKAKAHNGKHLGGPGKADYSRGKVLGEVKCRTTKVTKPELISLIKKKNIKEVDSKAGFTTPALEYQKKYHPEVKLMKHSKKI
jgi:hypothetical protein